VVLIALIARITIVLGRVRDKDAQIKKLSKDIEDIKQRAKAAKELLETRFGSLVQS
jgi:outer membrane murein-binding lipoprotein Lpp